MDFYMEYVHLNNNTHIMILPGLLSSRFRDVEIEVKYFESENN